MLLDLNLFGQGSRDDLLRALRGFRETYLAGGPPPPELAEIIIGCAAGLRAGHSESAVDLMSFYFDVIMYVPPALRTPGRGPAAGVLEALDRLAPELSVLRGDNDHRVATWAWHLLSWLPTRVPNLATEALEALAHTQRSSARITVALAAASTSEGLVATTALLSDWLTRNSEERDVAAMVLTQLRGDPQRAESTPDEVVDVLIGLAGRGRWQAWDESPSREFGYYADLAGCLVRAGYVRGERTLPVLLELARVCSNAEFEHVLDSLLKLFYHVAPYDGDARPEALSPLQRRVLETLVHDPRAWTPRPRFYATLRELGLPLGSTPLAAFLGIEPTPSNLEISDISPHGTLTLKTSSSPLELVEALLARSKS
jgi:hypothetical protein